MLYETLIDPLNFRHDASGGEDESGLWISAINALKDLAENGIILIDKNEVLRRSLFSSINTWAPKYIKKGSELLMKLEKENRFVKIKEDYPISYDCEKITCQHCIGMANVSEPSLFFLPSRCHDCAKSQIPAVIEVVDVNEYCLRENGPKEFILLDGELNQTEFEKKFLIPLFRWAKHVKIFDRQFGRSLQSNIDSGQRPFLPKNYVLSLTWILQKYDEYSIKKEFGIFEIYTELRDADTGKIAIDELCQFKDNLGADLTFKVDMVIKKRTNCAHMLHDRFIFTDQIGLKIGRGFDLLWDEQKMERNDLDPMHDPRPVWDTTLSYVSYSNKCKIDSDIRKLPDFNNI